MEYTQLVARFLGEEAQNAIEQILDVECRDLVVSFANPEEVPDQVLSFIRLHAESLAAEPTVYSAMRTALGSLIHQNKIAFKSYGFSRAGKKQHDDLLRSIGALEGEVVEPTAAEKLLVQVKADYTHLPTDELQRRLKDPSYAAAYHAMVTEAVQNG